MTHNRKNEEGHPKNSETTTIMYRAQCMGFASSNGQENVKPHAYMRREPQHQLSHGLCPECEKLYYTDWQKPKNITDLIRDGGDGKERTL